MELEDKEKGKEESQFVILRGKQKYVSTLVKSSLLLLLFFYLAVNKCIFTWLGLMDSDVLDSLDSITTSDSDVIIPQPQRPVKEVLKIVTEYFKLICLALGMLFLNVITNVYTYSVKLQFIFCSLP